MIVVVLLSVQNEIFMQVDGIVPSGFLRLTMCLVSAFTLIKSHFDLDNGPVPLFNMSGLKEGFI